MADKDLVISGTVLQTTRGSLKAGFTFVFKKSL
jgi:hypothetical protein